MNILGVIPARYKSTRFPGKPLADIHGRPMVARVYERAAAVGELSKVVVATDDQRIEKACADLGIPTVITSDRHPTGTDRLAEVADKIAADLYVNIQGDEPTLEPDTIRAAIKPFQESERPDFEVSNLMTPIRKQTDLMDSTVPKVVANARGDAVYLSRLPVPYPKETKGVVYYKQVCVYGFTPAALRAFAGQTMGPLEWAEGIELLRFIENGIKVRMIVVDQDTVAVDTPSDLETVREVTRSWWGA
ncbi:spore coat biosynthesis protein F [Desulfocarbo indianensis]|nr:spore coat biosynthesis protein F [Desulfocarbo indianensis]